MAVIDPRLLPLIEALAASGADWLAFELFDGLQVGRTADESDEELNQARLAIRAMKRDEGLPKKPEVRTPSSTPIIGNEQIDWAVNYVMEKISDSVRMLEASLIHLEAIVSNTRNSDVTFDARFSQSEGEVGLRIEGEDAIVLRSDIENAMLGLSALRDALSSWATFVKSGGPAS